MLHVAVVASPESRGIGTETGMVKAALLYADKVTLYSPTASIVSQFSQLKHFSRIEQIIFTAQMAESMGQPIDLRDLEKVLHVLQNGSRRERRKVERLFDKQLKEQWQNMVNVAEGFKQKFGITEVVQAIDAGFVDLHLFDWQKEGQEHEDGLVEEFTEAALSSVLNSKVLPLFDDPTNRLISAGIREGVFDVSGREARRGNPIALASFLFKQLPTWEKVPIDELLDIRKELQAPLIRFRAAVSKLISQESVAQWDEGFDEEATRILTEEVKPAVLEIEELVKTNSYLRQLANAVFSDAKTLTAILGLAAASSTELGSMLMGDRAGLVGVGASALTGLAKAYEAEQSRKGKQKEVERKEFYLYYHLRKRI